MTFFDAMKGYVQFDEAATSHLRAFHPMAEADFPRIIDDFYDAIQRHPGASSSITGGTAQIERLKRTLVSWLHEMLQGPHDEAYFHKRSRIGRVHVRIELPQSYMFTAMNRIRVHLVELARVHLADKPDLLVPTTRAMHQIMDLELAIMLETYREDLLAKARTAERLSTIGQFAAGIGHELRNPLGVIESSVYLVRKHLDKDPCDVRIVSRQLDKISAEVEHATHTITDLLELARDRSPRRQTVAVSALVSAAIEAARLPVGSQVDLVGAPEMNVDVDRDQLVRVLTNLLINAAQAAMGAGLVSRVLVEAQKLPGQTTVRVCDDGPGIPVDVRPHIFKALFTTRAKGTGLGLALCRRIVEAHGGAISLETGHPELRGACFLITIPDGEGKDLDTISVSP